MSCLRIALVLVLSIFLTNANADMMKCRIDGGIWNYFESSDKKEAKKCNKKSKLVVKSSGQKILNKYKNSGTEYSTKKTKAKFEPLTAARDVTPTCSSSGGTVKVNGKVFHLDKSAICKKYSSKKKGSLVAGKYKFNPRKYKVDAKFRSKIASFVEKTARKHGMDPAFIHAIISAESAYNPNATSHVGAQGLMQLMPFTAKRFGVTNPYNPYQNIEAGTRYLKLLYKEFGSLHLAAAGYNAGEGSVRKYNNKIPPYKETMKYVPKVMGFYRRYKNNKKLIASGK